MKNYKIIIVSIFAFSISIFSGDTNSNLKDKKRSFDTKSKSLTTFFDVFPAQALAEDVTKLKKIMDDADASYQAGDREKAFKNLEIGEDILNPLQKNYADFLGREVKEQIQAYTNSFAVKHKKDSLDKEENPPAKKSYNPKVEKASEYFTMAKREFGEAKKLDTEGNVYYSIVQYKRSLTYLIYAYKNSEIQIPEKLTAFQQSTIKKEKTE